MNAFREGQLVEARGMARLLPFLQEGSHEGKRIVLTAKGRLAKELQKSIGDVLINKDPCTVESIEVKTEQSNTHGNLFLETWSNRKWYNPGWMVTSDADWLLYLFLESDELYTVRLPLLKEWAWHHGNIYRFPEKPQKKYDQLNDTWGRCVPIATLVRESGLRRIALPRSAEAA